MLKALLKKQFLELNQFYFRDRKSGKHRSRGGVAAMIALYIGIFVLLGAALGAFENVLYQPLAALGYEWLYYLLCTLLSIVLGVFGSVFNTYAALYLPRDNDLLLSMPIPPVKLLAVRMTGVYAMGLLYEAIVYVPAVIVPWLHGDITVGAAAAQVVLLFLVGVLILVLTCALGWVVALVSTKLKNRSFITVLLSLAFIAVYYIFYFRLSAYIRLLVENADAVAEAMRTGAWPLYQLGLAATGRVSALAVTFGITAVLLAALMVVMARSFLRLASAAPGGKKAAYRRRTARTHSARSALLRKELRRFTSSATYMLNAGLGLMLMPLVALAALIKGAWLRGTLEPFLAEMPQLELMLPVLVAAAICLAGSMCFVSAPSVALEGKSIWLLQSLPVSSRAVLGAKERAHFWLAAPPALLLGLVLAAVLRFDAAATLAMLAALVAFVALTDALGLVLGLQKPNLSWTSEAVPIKQSMASLVVMLGGWALAVAVALGYWPLADAVSAPLYLGGVAAVFVLGAWLCDRWLARRGAAIFETL